MSRNILIAALALGSASAQAQTPTFNLTLTTANGGADTLFSWSYTGTISFTHLGTGTDVAQFTYAIFKGIDGPGVTSTNPGVKAYAGFDPLYQGDLSVFASGLNTGLVWTSTTDSTSTPIISVAANLQFGLIYLLNDMTNSPVFLSPGETVVLSGPTSGSFLSSVDFSNFNAGQWTFDLNSVSSGYNYTSVLTIGGSAPIPEPSTYGIVLGGLALAGAVIRRRKISK